MPESRDRLVRPVDIADLFARRRSGSLGVYVDQPELDRALAPPIPRQAAATGSVMFGVGVTGRGIGSPFTSFSGRGRGSPTGRGRNFHRTPASGRENTPSTAGRRGSVNRRGRGGSVLPSWYPRVPLRDITDVLRAIERRRERLRGTEGQEIGSPSPQELGVFVAPEPEPEPEPVAHLEHSEYLRTPIPTIGVNKPSCPPSVAKVQKILHDAANQASPGESEFVTPQKKLLNSIDTVEKQVMEELRKLKRTPSAKRAEREKRVRTLMSMR